MPARTNTSRSPMVVLIVREDGPARLAASRRDAFVGVFSTALRATLEASGFSHRPPSLWLIKRLLQRLGVRTWRLSSTPFTSDEGPEGERIQHPRMTPLAKRLLSAVVGGIEELADRRRENLRLWMQALDPDEVIAFSDRAKATPYLATVECGDLANATVRFEAWRRARAPVTTWPDLPPEVSTEPANHAKAIFLRRSRVYLPVHQTLNRKRLVALAQRLVKTSRV